jgi:hypothetical protein
VLWGKSDVGSRTSLCPVGILVLMGTLGRASPNNNLSQQRRFVTQHPQAPRRCVLVPTHCTSNKLWRFGPRGATNLGLNNSRPGFPTSQRLPHRLRRFVMWYTQTILYFSIVTKRYVSTEACKTRIAVISSINDILTSHIDRLRLKIVHWFENSRE